MDNSYEDIVGALTDYFDGFYTCDVTTLQKIFHPACHLYSATDGGLVDADMENVYKRIAKRESPASRGDARIDRVLSIDKSDEGTALVKLQIAIGDKLFTDFLSLIHLDHRWQIISKTYTYTALAAEQAQAQAAE
jgi:hypothetical protein